MGGQDEFEIVLNKKGVEKNFKVRPTTTLSDLKTDVWEILGCPVLVQQIRYKNMLLEDGSATMQALGINKGDKLQVTIDARPIGARLMPSDRRDGKKAGPHPSTRQQLTKK